ncbi:histidine kinase [Streptomyces sp. MAA16]|uniref:histidine kinase n=1 Tax=Streptomyces sp. MAA16 TaxID=3035116 RepID=UPI002473905C|nr:histidine kinase [Streptomyces sp. MAA16]MDH6700916.1 signal transduction histidine kinase [Streptomyces sp. MAA16]
MFEATVSTALRGVRIGRERWAALGVGTRDGVLAVLLAPVVFAPLTAPVGAEFGDLPTRPYDLPGLLLTAALWLPLTVRRRWPGACLAVIATAFAIRELAGYPATFASVGLYVALYGVGAHGAWRAREAGTAGAHGDGDHGDGDHGKGIRGGDVRGEDVRGEGARGRGVPPVTRGEETRGQGVRLAARDEGARGQGAPPVVAVGVGVGVVVASVLYVLFAIGLHGRGSPQGISDFVLIYAVLACCWAGGRAVRSWRAAEEGRRRAGVEAAMARERARIARELHDVVTHHVTAMVVQADAAQFVLADAPDRVATGLEAISDSGRRALTDLQHLLGVLNASGAGREGDRAPAPSPGTLGELVAHTRAAGQPVRLTEHGERRPMPSAVELAAYRVVQEALTNALKHAPGHPTHVQVRYGHEEIEVEVTTEPTPARGAVPAPRRAPVRGGGHGLVGLRERVGVFGGELRAGAADDGGFAVLARIPAGGGA